jgi:hypothetical protein
MAQRVSLFAFLVQTTIPLIGIWVAFKYVVLSVYDNVFQIQVLPISMITFKFSFVFCITILASNYYIFSRISRWLSNIKYLE